jgi:hypothetical protein
MSDPDALFAFLGPLLAQRERERWKRLATMKKRRENLHVEVGTGIFDKRYETIVSPKEADPSLLLPRLRKLGARDRCTVFGEGVWFEPWEASLDETISSLILTNRVANDEGDEADNVVVVCRPGRLVFTQDDYAFRRIIHRKA